MNYVNSRENKPLRVGTYVQYLASKWGGSKSITDPVIDNNYIIAEIKNGDIEYVKLRNHHGWWHAHDFIHQPWAKPGWSLK